jgi:hypothetical protein
MNSWERNRQSLFKFVLVGVLPASLFAFIAYHEGPSRAFGLTFLFICPTSRDGAAAKGF